MNEEWIDFKEKTPTVGDMVIVLYKTILGASPTKKMIWSQRDEEDFPYSPLMFKWRKADETKS